MSNGESSSVQTNCLCLFECRCREVEQLISDWTSGEAFETMNRRLLVFTKPEDIFARFACVLFYREILNGLEIKCTKANLKKADVAFQFAAAFVKEELNCLTFYTLCWAKFQELAVELWNGGLSYFSPACRQLFTAQLFIEQILPDVHLQSNSEPFGGPAKATDSSDDIVFIEEVSPKRVNVPNRVPTEVQQRSNAEPFGGSAKAMDSSVQPSEEISQTAQTVLEAQKQEGVLVKKEEEEESYDDVTYEPIHLYKNIPNHLGTESKLGMNISDSRRNGNVQPPKKRAKSLMNVYNGVIKAVAPTRISTGPQVRKQPVRESTLPPNFTGDERSQWHKCPIAGCERQFKHAWLIKRHQHYHHGFQKCYFACYECGCDFSLRGQLMSHIKLHDQSNPLACDECDFRFDCPLILANHKQHSHSPKAYQ